MQLRRPNFENYFPSPIMSSYNPVCSMLIKLVRNFAKNGCSIELNTLCLESWIVLIVQCNQAFVIRLFMEEMCHVIYVNHY